MISFNNNLKYLASGTNNENIIIDRIKRQQNILICKNVE